VPPSGQGKQKFGCLGRVCGLAHDPTPKCDRSISAQHDIIVIRSDSRDFLGGDAVHICPRDFAFDRIFVNVRGPDVIRHNTDLRQQFKPARRS
jgi:hypothetical protein